MQLELTGECSVFSMKDMHDEKDYGADYESILKGKTFDDIEEMDQWIDLIAEKHGICFDSFSFRENKTEEEEEEEWSDTLLAAMEESEATGQPFDHIMGEILGGVRG